MTLGFGGRPRGVRGWVGVQMFIGWLPIWVLYVAIMVTAHGEVSIHRAMAASARAIGAAAVLGLLVLRLSERVAWPRPMRASFVLTHALAAVLYALAWVAAISLLEAPFRGYVIIPQPPGPLPFIALGVWLYVAVAGVSYAAMATERAARAEALAARAQLAALRAQLNPHFLFNALHTVVQLIPVEPARAANAAEQLAALLRTSIEEERDRVSLAEERAFVERYLELERVRFGERLVVAWDVAPDAEEALLPAFALQSLVENAVRHGAAPRVDATRIAVTAKTEGGRLVLRVEDDGVGAEPAAVWQGAGTGLRRLRERLEALYGGAASLDVETRAGGGFRATLSLPAHEEPRA
jgi:signal transduction histidine kinase